MGGDFSLGMFVPRRKDIVFSWCGQVSSFVGILSRPVVCATRGGGECIDLADLLMTGAAHTEGRADLTDT